MRRAAGQAATLALAAAALIGASAEPEISRIAFGSCRKQRLQQPIWRAVSQQDPELWLWGGDAVYPKPGADEAELRQAYVKAEADEDARKFFSSVPYVDGTYDDHDYGENDAGRTFEGREAARQAFLDLAIKAAPDSPRRSQPGGLYAARVFGQPPRQLKVILLDTRYSRDTHAIPSPGGWKHVPKAGYVAGLTRSVSAMFNIGRRYQGDVLGEEQWQWLRRELTNSTASVHLIVSSIQVLTSVPAVESWGHFPYARERLLSLLQELRPAGALLLSGDVHYSELIGPPEHYFPPHTHAEAVAGGAQLLEVTASGLTHSCGRGVVGGVMCRTLLRQFRLHRLPIKHSRPEVDPNAIDGAHTQENFATITISWPQAGADGAESEEAGSPSPVQQPGELKLQIHDVDGAVVLEHRLVLGLDPQVERARWQAALRTPTIFEASKRFRLPVLLVVVLVGMRLLRWMVQWCTARPKHAKTS